MTHRTVVGDSYIDSALDKQRLARLMHKPQVRTQWRGTEAEHRLHPLDGIQDDSTGAAR
jgi:hypothetical protein